MLCLVACDLTRICQIARQEDTRVRTHELAWILFAHNWDLTSSLKHELNVDKDNGVGWRDIFVQPTMHNCISDITIIMTRPRVAASDKYVTKPQDRSLQHSLEAQCKVAPDTPGILFSLRRSSFSFRLSNKEYIHLKRETKFDFAALWFPDHHTALFHLKKSWLFVCLFACLLVCLLVGPTHIEQIGKGTSSTDGSTTGRLMHLGKFSLNPIYI